MVRILSLNEIHCMDCCEGLKQLDDECIDMMITSPPYDALRDYKKGFKFDIKTLCEELYRTCKMGAVIVWVVDDGFIDGKDGGKTKSGSSLKQALSFMFAGFNIHDYMIYRKKMIPLSAISKVRYYNRFEFMWVFSKGKPKTINLIKDRENTWQNQKWDSVNVRTKEGELKKVKDGSDIKPIEKYGVRDNIWSYATGFDHSTKDKMAKEHPAIFPEQLVEDHIKSWSNSGDVILDPFMGSGTTAKIAKQLGRQFIGFEISEEYCKIANKRLSKHQVIDDWL